MFPNVTFASSTECLSRGSAAEIKYEFPKGTLSPLSSVPLGAKQLQIASLIIQIHHWITVDGTNVCRINRQLL